MTCESNFFTLLPLSEKKLASSNTTSGSERHLERFPEAIIYFIKLDCSSGVLVLQASHSSETISSLCVVSHEDQVYKVENSDLRVVADLQVTILRLL